LAGQWSKDNSHHSHAIEGGRERCLEAGMNEYIAKPVRIQDLKIALKDISRP
jgi:CheY-like chemotaxis protein